jgi:hypothetical protein
MIDPRIHEYLDGDRPFEELSAEERERASEIEAGLADVSGALRSIPAPDLTSRIMAALPPVLQAESPERVTSSVGAARRLLSWVWTPRPLQVRPAYGLVAAVLAILAGVGLAREVGRTPQTMEGSETAVFVQFRFEAPGAAEVALAGTFTEWEPRFQLRETAPGVWSALVPLEPGVHDYVFVIDGTQWTADPHAFLVDDSFGGTNSRITLLPPARGT